MFEIDPGEDINLIVDVVQRFSSAVLSEQYRDFEAAKALPATVLNDYAALGLGSLELPEALGGAGLGSRAKIAVLEELGYGDPGATLALDGIGPALYAIAELGGESALNEYILPRLGDPGARIALIWDDGGVRKKVGLRRNGDHYIGTEPWIPCQQADLLVILDRQGVSIVDSGFTLKAIKGSGLRAAGAAEVVFDQAPIAMRWDDPAAAARALAKWQLYISALLVGVFRVAADTSREYAMDRVAFGKPIAHHQALAFLIVDMQTAVDSTRLLMQDAACRADAGQPFEAAAASAFAEAVETSMFVTPNALQIFGGQGFMQDLPLEKYMREARTLGLMAGGVDLAREVAGQDVCAMGATVELSALALAE
ncbi:MAG: acyl-CoA dehydrogenase family protein [Gammaproteobacteria bacterium]|nr:acyl-CoA dehydrogenase family protein [Gammaproteobacteria bacterium]MBQ0840461.1 acyl-CoA dehydrogenase family protein [Gammaproteobacteria bacterium]